MPLTTNIKPNPRAVELIKFVFCRVEWEEVGSPSPAMQASVYCINNLRRYHISVAIFWFCNVSYFVLVLVFVFVNCRLCCICVVFVPDCVLFCRLCCVVLYTIMSN